MAQGLGAVMKYLAKDWNIGDTVRLKSGGPLMTVNEVYFDDDDDNEEVCTSVDCIWFTGGDPLTWGELRIEKNIHPACLINSSTP